MNRLMFLSCLRGKERRPETHVHTFVMTLVQYTTLYYLSLFSHIRDQMSQEKVCMQARETVFYT